MEKLMIKHVQLLTFLLKRRPPSTKNHKINFIAKPHAVPDIWGPKPIHFLILTFIWHDIGGTHGRGTQKLEIDYP